MSKLSERFGQRIGRKESLEVAIRHLEFRDIKIRALQQQIDTLEQKIAQQAMDKMFDGRAADMMADKIKELRHDIMDVESVLESRSQELRAAEERVAELENVNTLLHFRLDSAMEMVQAREERIDLLEERNYALREERRCGCGEDNAKAESH